MIQNRRMFVGLAACVCLFASTALAGGGGAKRNATLVVKSDADFPVGLLINPTPQQEQAAAAATTLDQFRAAGGKVINARGGEARTSVVAGDQRVVLVNLNTRAPYADQKVAVARGATVTVKATNSGLSL
ncbi:MAG: hypothetical protein R3C53_12875 [Pirellulaceae bacterium]